jgi:hypothetical protein
MELTARDKETLRGLLANNCRMRGEIAEMALREIDKEVVDRLNAAAGMYDEAASNLRIVIDKIR